MECVGDYKRRRWGGRGVQPLLVVQRSATFGQFPKRTIENSGEFSDCSPDHFTHSGRNFTAPLNLKLPYAYFNDE